MRKYGTYSVIFIIFALVGILDASYLTYEHYSHVIPPCSTNLLFLDCGKVLMSKYAIIVGIPLSLLGLFHYIVLLFNIIFNYFKNYKFYTYLFIQVALGFLFSLYLISLQLFVIHAFCFYCMISAINSILLGLVVFSFYRKRNQQIKIQS